MRSLVAALGASVALLFATPTFAGTDTTLSTARVVYANGTSLWVTDGAGKATATEFLALSRPASDVRALVTSSSGAVLAMNLAGQWSWMPTTGTRHPLTALPCAGDAGLTISPDGVYAVCGALTAQGGTAIVRFSNGKTVTRTVPSNGARLTGTGANRELVWADADGVWAAPAKRPADLANRRKLAPAPLRDLSINQTGTRAMGVFAGIVRKGHVETAAELLYGFALDGTAARRKSIRGGRVIDWSADGVWALVQDGSKACVMRVVGGEYKCWKGYNGISLSPDGNYALLLGATKAAAAAGDSDDVDDAADPGGDGEGESDEDESADASADSAAAAAIHGPRSLLRARLPGTYTTSPSTLVSAIDGPAVWLAAP